MIGELYYEDDEMVESQALGKFWDDIVEDRMVIAVDFRDGVVEYAEVMSDATLTALALRSGSLLRYWSGRVLSAP